MKKLYKEIQKRIPKDYEEIAFQVSSENRKLGLNKYEFNTIRDRIYEEVEKMCGERMPANERLTTRLKHLNDKLVVKAEKKTHLENFANYLFIIFVILSVLFPLLYGINFNKPETNSVYSKGLDLFISYNNMFLTVVYATVGVLITAIFQNITSSQRKMLIGVSLTIGIILGVTFYALGSINPDFRLRINFIAIEVVCLLMAIGGFFLEDFVAKKNYSKRHTSENTPSEEK